MTQQVVGFSSYLHGIQYDLERFRRELDEAVAYIKKQEKRPQRKRRAA